MNKKKESIEDIKKWAFVSDFPFETCVQRLQSWKRYPIDVTQYDENSASFKIYSWATHARDVYGTLERNEGDKTRIDFHLDTGSSYGQMAQILFPLLLAILVNVPAIIIGLLTQSIAGFIVTLIVMLILVSVFERSSYGRWFFANVGSYSWQILRHDVIARLHDSEKIPLEKHMKIMNAIDVDEERKSKSAS